MILRKVVGATAIAGGLGLSTMGLVTGVANAATAPQDVSNVVQSAQLTGWHGGGWHGGGWHGGGRGWGGPGYYGGGGWGGPGYYGGGWGGPPPPCFVVCL